MHVSHLFAQYLELPPWIWSSFYQNSTSTKKKKKERCNLLKSKRTYIVDCILRIRNIRNKPLFVPSCAIEKFSGLVDLSIDYKSGPPTQDWEVAGITPLLNILPFVGRRLRRRRHTKLLTFKGASLCHIQVVNCNVMFNWWLLRRI